MEKPKKFNPAHTEAIAKIVNTSPYIVLLSMELRNLNRGESLIKIETEQKHHQAYGIIHGGVCASLLDTAIYWAVYAGIEEIVGLTTIDLKVNYLSPVSDGRLIAKGRSIKTGNKICLGEASIEDQNGNLVAHGTSTLMVLNKLELPGQADLPPKFIYEENV
jgi:uncharacterized protein (TIGR00369 family)